MMALIMGTSSGRSGVALVYNFVNHLLVPGRHNQIYIALSVTLSPPAHDLYKPVSHNVMFGRARSPVGGGGGLPLGLALKWRSTSPAAS